MEINLLKYNRHWQEGFFYPYPKTRFIFKSLVSSLSSKFIIELVGLRRLGKSTLLYQLINQLIQSKKINRFRILYFTFDEEPISIEKLLDLYETKTEIDYKKEKIYVFLDEIQKLKNFQNQIKVYYDLYPNIKFIISGSTSLFIRKKTQESLAGRIKSFTLKPLTLPEYLYFKEKQELLKKPLLYKNELEKELKTFLTSQFIESLDLKSQQEKKEYYQSIIKKIIFEDLPSLFSINHPEILLSLVKNLAFYPGSIINLLHLSFELKISNKTLSAYLLHLEESFLIKKLYNFSKNPTTSEKRLKKFFLASPSFSFSFADFVDWGKLFENYFASILETKYFWQDVYKNEVDFIKIDSNQTIVPIEIKYKQEVNKNDFKNLLLFCKKYQVKKGCIYYLGEKKMIKNQEKTIILEPYYLI